MRKFLLGIFVLFAVTFGVWWISAAPLAGLHIAPAYKMGDVPPGLAAAASRW